MKIQYCMFTIVFFILFVIVSFGLMPFAYLMGIIDKFKNRNMTTDKIDKIINMSFILTGPLILVLDTITDVYYFWMNNFRTDLKVIIITREAS